MGIILETYISYLWILNLQYSACKWLFVFILVFLKSSSLIEMKNEISFSGSKVCDYTKLESRNEWNVERNRIIHHS